MQKRVILLLILFSILLTGCGFEKQRQSWIVNLLNENYVDERVQLINEWYADSFFVVTGKSTVPIKNTKGRIVRVTTPSVGSIYHYYTNEYNTNKKIYYSSEVNSETEHLYVISATKLFNIGENEKLDRSLNLVLDKINTSLVEIENEKIWGIPKKEYYNDKTKTWEFDLSVFETKDLLNGLEALLRGKEYFNTDIYDKTINKIYNTLENMQINQGVLLGAISSSIYIDNKNVSFSEVFPLYFTESFYTLNKLDNKRINSMYVNYMKFAEKKISSDTNWSEKNVPFTGVTKEDKRFVYSDYKNKWNTETGNMEDMLSMIYGLYLYDEQHSDLVGKILDGAMFDWANVKLGKPIEIKMSNQISKNKKGTLTPYFYLSEFEKINNNNEDRILLMYDLIRKQNTDGNKLQKGAIEVDYGTTLITETFKIVNQLIDVYK